MKKYQIIIRETLERIVEVEAESMTEALGMVEDDYNASEIVLGGEDFQGVEIEPF